MNELFIKLIATMNILYISSFGYNIEYPNEDDKKVFSVANFPSPPKRLLKYNGLQSTFIKQYWNDVTNKYYNILKDDILQLIKKQKINTIYIGCAMGKHRSVACVERLKNDLDLLKMYDTIVICHTSIKKNNVEYF